MVKSDFIEWLSWSPQPNWISEIEMKENTEKYLEMIPSSKLFSAL